MTKEFTGLRTQEALDRLHKELDTTVSEFSRISKRNWVKSWLRDSLHPTSPFTFLPIISIVLCLFLVILLLFSNEITVGLFMFLLLLSAVSVTLWENKLRHEEVLHHAKELCELVWKSRDVRWTTENYPHNSLPASPCITLQLTYRDGELINLPWALLVKGDVIVIKPGQASPGLCTPLEDKNGPILHAHEVYSPPVASQSDRCTHPIARAPLEPRKYLMQETPYIKNLKLGLEQALKRPVAIHDRERHLLLVNCLQYSVLPIGFVLSIIANTARYINLYKWVSRGEFSEMFLLQPILVVLPLIPLVYPLFWWFLNCFEVSKIRAILQDATPNQEQSDPFEEPDISESKDGERQFGCWELWRFWVDALIGKCPLLMRSINIVDVLGTVTALCCVDKKGILSWPNPTAEKVFILRSNDEHKKSSDTLQSEGYNSQWGDEEGRQITTDPRIFPPRTANAVAEVLDLTHDHASPFRLHFDDPSWKQYLNSLKPLGLAILLNTCNVETQETYGQFCSHITCEALLNESLVPVTNRRCLCELASEIGFVEQVQQGFKFELPLCTFKQLRPEIVKRDIKFARQLPTKLKFPFPHMMATVIKDKQTGCHQLFSQGTADIILDSCVEYWDGHDLHPLTNADRKKIIDFYQRTSLSANCTAFAYRPLYKTLSPNLSHVYLELPCDSTHLHTSYRSPTPMAFGESKWRGVLAGFHSSDSLLGCETKEEVVEDIEGCFDVQCNQIFIGMVTMQYQAQADMVQLIEQLERACIRFVHFSKENELRSRVFSEKMGLESGWNCHISLLSDRNRSENGDDVSILEELEEHEDSTPLIANVTSSFHPLSSSIHKQVLELNERTNLASSRAFSFSAPSAINLDVTTVKIGEEVTWPEDKNVRRVSQVSENEEQWRSLSCLTDSTDQSVPFNFDISNRAKLPRGIDKIRPHLENIDNVPLLVSLFTDCTPNVTWEMLKIMQEYGEAVVVLGSSANCDNMPIFMQANASIAVEPLYPQVCQKVPAFMPSYNTLGERIVQPVDISRRLNSFTCAISVRREDPISILRLIMQARHSTHLLRNSLQFAMCSSLSLSLVSLCGAIFMMPPMFTVDQVAFTAFLLIPLLSASLIGLPMDTQIMQTATGKNRFDFNWEVVSFVLWCYGLKFLPAVVSVLSFHLSILSVYCHDLVTNATCTFLYMELDEEFSWGGWSHMPTSFLYTQHLSQGLFIFHLVVISMGFVHRNDSIWMKKSPTENFIWLLAALFIPTLQIINSAIILSTFDKPDKWQSQNHSLPWFLPFFAVFSLFITFATNEAVKWQEIKVNKRFQRRKRLDFGTKLGMNSPF